MKELGHELDNVALEDLRHGPPRSWVEEFHQTPHFAQVDPEFDRIYQQHAHQPSGGFLFLFFFCSIPS